MPYPGRLTEKVWESGRIVKVGVVVATAVGAEGRREIIGMDVETSEAGSFWLALLRSLTARRFSGVELVDFDARHWMRDASSMVFANTELRNAGPTSGPTGSLGRPGTRKPG